MNIKAEDCGIQKWRQVQDYIVYKYRMARKRWTTGECNLIDLFSRPCRALPPKLYEDTRWLEIVGIDLLEI